MRRKGSTKMELARFRGLFIAWTSSGLLVAPLEGDRRSVAEAGRAAVGVMPSFDALEDPHSSPGMGREHCA